MALKRFANGVCILLENIREDETFESLVDDPHVHVEAYNPDWDEEFKGKDVPLVKFIRIPQ